jgi:hypothetical protein
VDGVRARPPDGGADADQRAGVGGVAGAASGQQRIDDLEALVRELQSGVEAMRAQRVRLLEGTRVGADLQNGTIEIARGSSHGVRAGALVTARRSQQIVGIVTDAGHLTSTVRLLTDARFQPKLMRGVVMPEEPVTPELLATLPVVQLRPAGDGTLITDLPIASATAEALKEGQEIRLRDDAWPSAAQMLVLGRVERVEQTRDRDVLWRHVRVRPALDNDLARVGSVMLLIPADDLPAPAGATGGRP